MICYIKLSDTELQKLAVTGDREAEEQLAMRYLRLVRSCARPFFLAGGDSEDLTQEGMFGLLSAIRQYDETQNAAFKTFAEHCIRNRIISAVRSASAPKHTPLNEGVSLDSLLSDESQTHLSAYSEMFRQSPEEQVLARENVQEIFLSFKECLSKFENSVLEFFLDGLSYHEIANLTGKDVKAVDNAIQRIRRKLAQKLNSGDISGS